MNALTVFVAFALVATVACGALGVVNPAVPAVVPSLGIASSYQYYAAPTKTIVAPTAVKYAVPSVPQYVVGNPAVQYAIPSVGVKYVAPSAPVATYVGGAVRPFGYYSSYIQH